MEQKTVDSHTQLHQEHKLGFLYALRSDIEKIDTSLDELAMQERDINERWNDAYPIDQAQEQSFRAENSYIKEKVKSLLSRYKATFFGSEGQYVNGRATFRAEVGEKYLDKDENPTGYAILEEAMATYARNFVHHTQRPEHIEETAASELLSLIKNRGRGQQMGGWWRYAVDSFGGEHDFDDEPNPGIKIKYFHNCNNGGAPGPGIEDGSSITFISDLKSQLKFRRMITDVEIKLLEEKVEYRLNN